MSSFLNLPANLPVPENDGACDHLQGSLLPALSLASTEDSLVNLSCLEGTAVLYFYPLTGRPDTPLPQGWDEIPGARGCTPQSCGFRERHLQFSELQTMVYGISAQSSDYQREVKARLHLPFELLSDQALQLKRSIGIPTFIADGMELYKRVTLVCRNAVIRKVFYPVFPPDKNAADVIRWLSDKL